MSVSVFHLSNLKLFVSHDLDIQTSLPSKSMSFYHEVKFLSSAFCRISGL